MLSMSRGASVNVIYDASRATTASGSKPASQKRSRILVTSSVRRFSCDDIHKTRMGLRSGSGTVPSGAAQVASGRPSRNRSGGAPAQLLTPTAEAN